MRRTQYAIGFLAGGCFAMGAAFAMHRWAGLAFGLLIAASASVLLKKGRPL